MELAIEARSIVNHDTWVSMKELRKIESAALNDMLAVERFPKILFRSTSIARLSSGVYEVRGVLTIRDISKPVVVMATWNSAAAAPAFEGTAQVRLTDFGLKPPSAVLGAIGTKNEMSFRFVLMALPLRSGSA